MPDKTSLERILRALEAAGSAVDALSSSLGAIKGELAALEQEAEDLAAETLNSGGQDPEIPQLTQEELGIASVKMLLTFREAAGLLSVSVATIGDMVDRGELPVCKIGRNPLRIPRKQLQEMVEGENRPSGEKPGKTRS